MKNGLLEEKDYCDIAEIVGVLADSMTAIFDGNEVNPGLGAEVYCLVLAHINFMTLIQEYVILEEIDQ